MSKLIPFPTAFEALTGNAPFPWQELTCAPPHPGRVAIGGKPQ
jgi:hypothetical protein